jgi:cysteine desulfurase
LDFAMPVYLDNNATTPLDPRVLEAMLPYLQGVYGNPSSVHRYGRLTSGAVERAREQVAALVGAHAGQVIFTSGGTEANNLAVNGIAGGRSGGHIAISAIEHPSLLEPALALRGRGCEVDEIPVNADGVVDCAALTGILRQDTILVAVMLANNETGAVQPVAEVARYLANGGAVLHTDASQAAGKIPVDFAASGAQLMTLSSHKLYGPLGAGALIVDRSVALQPVQLGGGHENGLRSGTPNVAAIAGFGAAAELARLELAERAARMRALRSRLETALHAVPEIYIFAEAVERLPNTVQFGIRGCHGETLLLQLDRLGFAVSSGSACHSDVQEASHVLRAMRVETDLALAAVRVSLGKDTAEADVDRFVAALTSVVEAFRGSSVRVANV